MWRWRGGSERDRGRVYLAADIALGNGEDVERLEALSDRRNIRGEERSDIAVVLRLDIAPHLQRDEIRKGD